MADDLFDEDGTFDDGFFSSLAASPDDPESLYEPAAETDAAEDGDYDFLYESEGDGSFETDADDFGFEDLDYGDDYYDYGYDDESDPGADDAEIDLEPDFDADHDLISEGDREFLGGPGPGSEL